MKFTVLLVAAMVIATLKSNAQTDYTFKINNKSYTINEDDLDQHFGTVFNQLIAAGWTKQKYFEIWTASYLQWKKQALSCPMTWRLYGDNVAEFARPNCPTPTNESMGLDKKGNPAKGNLNKPDNHAGRMAMLNRTICGSLSQRVKK